MSYIPVGLTPTEVKSLRLQPEEIEQLPVDTRAELALRHREIQAAESDSFWNAVQAFGTALLPIGLAVLGIRKWGN